MVNFTCQACLEIIVHLGFVKDELRDLANGNGLSLEHIRVSQVGSKI